MKAVIVEIRGDSAAVLSNGYITKVCNKNYEIGQVIEIAAVKKSPRKMISWASSAAAVIIVSVISAFMYYSPYAYVSLDVNPSIEYSVNRFERVLSAEAVNDDGEAILQNLHLNNMEIESAVRATVQQIVADGYIPETESGGIVIAASCANETKSVKIADALGIQAEEVVTAAGLEAEIESESVSKDFVNEAKELGVTPGKLMLVQKLQASAGDETINVEEWLNQPVKEILKAIKGNRDAGNNSHKADESATSDSSESNSGKKGTSDNGTTAKNAASNGSSKIKSAGNSSSKENVTSKNGSTGTGSSGNSSSDNKNPENDTAPGNSLSGNNPASVNNSSENDNSDSNSNMKANASTEAEKQNDTESNAVGKETKQSQAEQITQSANKAGNASANAKSNQP